MNYLKKLFRFWLNLFIDLWAKNQHFCFPKKYTWRWKLNMLAGYYEPETTAFFKKTITAGMTVIDIGAHIGYYTRLFSKLTGASGRVIAFEPEPDNWQLLQKNTANLKNVQLFNLAISDQDGQAQFYKIKNSTGCHSLIPKDSSEIIQITAATIDSLLADNRISLPDIIKIDIEGAEYKALGGMKNLFKNCRRLKIITEISTDSLKLAGATPAAFLELLSASGFKLFAIVEGGKTKPLAEHFFETNRLAEKNAINLLAEK